MVHFIWLDLNIHVWSFRLMVLLWKDKNVQPCTPQSIFWLHAEAWWDCALAYQLSALYNISSILYCVYVGYFEKRTIRMILWPHFIVQWRLMMISSIASIIWMIRTKFSGNLNISFVSVCFIVTLVCKKMPANAYQCKYCKTIKSNIRDRKMHKCTYETHRDNGHASSVNWINGFINFVSVTLVS